ncbi:MAG TPA: ABC transporter ATP-binding protein [Acidimicrobiales bacterium]|nr:ABC transporter ATP-binding protein [Acidimicrobiales bacterium]
MSSTLSVRNLTVRYGGMTAVDDFSFDVPAGSAVGLIGPNGAGKTSVIDALSGFARSEGDLFLDEVPFNHLPPHERMRCGLSRTFQSLELFDDLTVRENTLIGTKRSPLALRGGARASRRDEVANEVDDALAFLGLQPFADSKVRDLSQGHRKLTCLARAMASRPGVLLLDEPAAGLDSRESAWLCDKLTLVRDQGVSILLVDHDMTLVLNACSTVYVLNFGVCIAAGPPDTIRADESVISTYLGSREQKGEQPDGTVAHH